MPSRMEKMKIDEKGNVEWYSRQNEQHERGMETGKQGTLEQLLGWTRKYLMTNSRKQGLKDGCSLIQKEPSTGNQRTSACSVDSGLS